MLWLSCWSQVCKIGFWPPLGEIQYYKIGICCFSANFVALLSTVKDLSFDWWNQDIVYKWSDFIKIFSDNMILDYSDINKNYM